MKKQITRTLAVAAVLALGATGLAACGSSTNVDESKGKVYYLNFKPESADQWKAIAETYTKVFLVKSVFRVSSLIFFGFRHEECRPVVCFTGCPSCRT